MEYLKRYETIELGKSCYIYPKGGCAEILSNILKDCKKDIALKFLDDSDSVNNLASKQEEIKKSGDYVLVCAGDVQDKLVLKCESLGLKYLDGREFIAFCLGQQILLEASGGGAKFRVLENGGLHIFDNPYITHYYFFYDLFVYYVSPKCLESLNQCALEYASCIKKALLEVGFKLEVSYGISLSYVPHTHKIATFFSKDIPIEWYFGSYEYYLEHKQNVLGDRVLIAPWILIDFFVSKKVVLWLSGIVPKLSYEKKIVVGMGHSIAEAFCFFPRALRQEYLEQYIGYYFLGFDYYLAIDRASLKAYESVFRAVGVKTRAIAGGSPRLDLKLEQSSALRTMEQFLFIPRSSKPNELMGIIKRLLEMGKKVLFRPHPAYRNYYKWIGKQNPYACLEVFLSYENFSFDESVAITSKSLSKSIVITDNSSLSYSAPLNSLKPVILYAPPKKEFDLRVCNFGHSFVNPLLHRVAFNEEEFMQVALGLEEELKDKGEVIAQEILEYKEANIFYPKHSALEIAKLLMSFAKS
ncbi:hypothetical protein [Helicobacter mesocricetorum]|uniref:hypothetical protein n=1 Tax=Helicobacter mesocricetorum TaxID=87012 RepID=UPI000CF05A38|nr:hypothetical protein [Helicobacter mesocricetorum]